MKVITTFGLEDAIREAELEDEEHICIDREPEEVDDDEWDIIIFS